jgi:hypothetical protein
MLGLYHPGKIYDIVINMKTAQKKTPYLVLILALFFSIIPFPAFAASEDFGITTDTEISYTTGNSYVTVENTYTREVFNSSYYYPASGEKIFHIPDYPGATEEEIVAERAFKTESISVTSNTGKSINYTLEELDSGSGMYVKIPNYKQTTTSSPYEIVFTYDTHDYVHKAGDWVNITAPALPEDIEFEKTDDSAKTTTLYDYNLDIVVDENISELAKIYPTKYTEDSINKKTHYSFNAVDRIGNSVYLEFGTSQVFKFELEYTTPKTDNLIPSNYSNILKSLSTNIYEISLPREFAETNQQVMFSSISPTPKSLSRDTEGNLIATFEVPANEESKIAVEGYVWVEQNSLENTEDLPVINYQNYLEEVNSSDFLQKYLTASTYWEINDSLIQESANELKNYQTDLIELIKTDYQFVNEKLEYDNTKATSENERIGAKAALEGGPAVCMEYADLMIALLRAQGVPARAALGYANLEEFTYADDDQVRHQWVQVWLPDYGWFSVDPTYESSNMKLGADINRILWETFNGDSLSNIKVYSADRLEALDSEGYKVKIYAVDEPDTAGLMSYLDLVPDQSYESIDDLPIADEYSALSWINTFLKATTIGKALIITGPILLGLVLITLVITLIKVVTKKIRRKKTT